MDSYSKALKEIMSDKEKIISDKELSVDELLQKTRDNIEKLKQRKSVDEFNAPLKKKDWFEEKDEE